jgi:hypothetical protein
MANTHSAKAMTQHPQSQDRATAMMTTMMSDTTIAKRRGTIGALACSIASPVPQKELGRESGWSPIMATMTSLLRLVNGTCRTIGMVIMVRSRRHATRARCWVSGTPALHHHPCQPLSLTIEAASSIGSAMWATKPLPVEEG